MDKVYILFKKTDYHGNVIIRIFKNESDAIDEELYLSRESPSNDYFVSEHDVE